MSFRTAGFVSGGHDIGTCSVNLGVNRESRSVDRILPFYYLAMVVHQNQVRSADLAKMHAEGIDPEMIEMFGVAGGDVAGNAFIEPEAGEQAKRASQALFAILPLLGHGSESRRDRKVEGILGGYRHGRLQTMTDYYSAGGWGSQHWWSWRRSRSFAPRVWWLQHVVANNPFGNAAGLCLALVFDYH